MVSIKSAPAIISQLGRIRTYFVRAARRRCIQHLPDLALVGLRRATSGSGSGATMTMPLLSEDDIQERLDEKNPAELVNALYQMLEPPAWADELCTPAAPTTTPAPHMFTECMQRPHIPAWPKTAIGDAEVGTLFVGTPPLRADALPPKRPRDEFECHTIVRSELLQQQQHLASVQNEKQLACPNCGAERVCAARAGHKATLRYQQALAEAERARLQAAPWTQGPLLAARRNRRRGLVRLRPSSAYCLRHATPATCPNEVPTGKFQGRM